MTYNEKKSLYESIMNNVAKVVKTRLNESEESIINYEKEYVSSHKDANGKLSNKDRNHMFMTEAALTILKLIHQADPSKFNKEKLEERMRTMFEYIQRDNLEKDFVNFLLKNWD